MPFPSSLRRSAKPSATPHPSRRSSTTMSGGFTAASLEVVHQEAIGMEQQFAGKFEEALQSFSKAAELDPNFARAYSGMAASALNLDRQKRCGKIHRSWRWHMRTG